MQWTGAVGVGIPVGATVEGIEKRVNVRWVRNRTFVVSTFETQFSSFHLP